MHDKILQFLTQQDDFAWKSTLFQLVTKEGMNPWDVDVSQLASAYLDYVRNAENTNLSISGKVLLAAAILVNLKSRKLVGEYIDDFDRLLASAEEQKNDDDLFGETTETLNSTIPNEIPELIPRIPQLRKRKVSIYDLVAALEKALEVKQRRLFRQEALDLKLILPGETVNIHLLTQRIYKRILDYLHKQRQKSVTFAQLINNAERREKVLTFIPLLHLSNERKINIDQPETFGTINITLNRKAI